MVQGYKRDEGHDGWTACPESERQADDRYQVRSIDEIRAAIRCAQNRKEIDSTGSRKCQSSAVLHNGMRSKPIWKPGQQKKSIEDENEAETNTKNSNARDGLFCKKKVF